MAPLEIPQWNPKSRNPQGFFPATSTHSQVKGRQRSLGVSGRPPLGGEERLVMPCEEVPAFGSDPLLTNRLEVWSLLASQRLSGPLLGLLQAEAGGSHWEPTCQDPFANRELRVWAPCLQGQRPSWDSGPSSGLCAIGSGHPGFFVLSLLVGEAQAARSALKAGRSSRSEC